MNESANQTAAEIHVESAERRGRCAACEGIFPCAAVMAPHREVDGVCARDGHAWPCLAVILYDGPLTVPTAQS